MENRNKNKRKMLSSLLTLSMVLLFLFFSPFSSLPLPSVIPTATATFSSITITDVTPTEFSPGDTREVIVTVKNNGGTDARDIKLAFQGTEIVSLVGPTVAQIDTLNSWTSKEVKITVHVKEEAPNGVYSIPIACSWNEITTKTTIVGYTTQTLPDGTTITSPNTRTDYNFPEPKSTQLGINFNIKGRAIINVGDITTDPTDIRPGDENVELRAVIENSGEAAAKDIEAKLFLNGKFTPSWSGTDRSYIGRLNSGEKGEAIFHIDIADGIESKMYSIPLRIKYKDTKGVEYEVMREINILVKPKPDFEIVSYYTEPANVSAGDTGVKLHVRIRNVGSEKAESVSVRSTREAEVPFKFDVKSDYVGNLKPGEEWTAVLKFDVDKGASPKAYQQGIEIRCTGDRDLGDYNVYLFDKMIPISVSSSSTGTFSVPGFEILFALIALFMVFILFLRRKR
ncbi:MAG: PGF-CTERM sorting domain-containing protein [Methanophagales archaeon]|nr:PGF-CTERM sorting domain-containing protein [Methanophagales archaeon]